MQDKTYQLFTIGTIEKTGKDARLRIHANYRDGLDGLEDFSHIKVFWWFDRNDVQKTKDGRPFRGRLKAHPPMAHGKEVGIFASRSPHRPNLIGITTCKIENIDIEEGIIDIDFTQAFEKSPIIDIKPYIPKIDKVEDATIPDWLK
ncbi:MAG: tRNA (N6-threonylcarbamoyladenosine(37)-N6)-methyltransferase TrmO [Candidatus Zixiibacteriota bacterium]